MNKWDKLNKGVHFEQRVKQAQEQKDDFYGTERSVAEVLAELGLPKESTVKGYVIHLPEKDEFVAAINDNNISFFSCLCSDT